jgi:hypothetical protein
MHTLHGQYYSYFEYMNEKIMKKKKGKITDISTRPSLA